MAYVRWLTVLVVCAAAATLIATRVWLPSRTADSEWANAGGLVRITPQRIPMREQTMLFCRSPEEIYGPHTFPAEIHLYANEIALAFRREHPRSFEYPIGTRFEKQKYSEVADSEPNVATIMERTGMAGDVLDWSFSIVSLPAKTPLKQVDGMSCAECHGRYKDTGYVSDVSESALKEFLGIE